MDARLDIVANPVGRKVTKYLASAGLAVKESALPATTHELVQIRASQINGCGFCLDMHTRDATRAGETPARMNLVATWREATVFTDAAWANAAKHFDEDQLAALVCTIAVINAFNRANVILQQPAGDYLP